MVTPSPATPLTAVSPTSAAATSPVPQVTARATSNSDYPINLLTGPDFAGPTGLMIVADDRIIDVDRGLEQPILGLPNDDRAFVWAIDVAGRAVLTVDGEGATGPEVFVWDRDSNTADAVGVGFPSPAPDGIWLTRYLSDTECTLTKVGFDGGTLRPAQRWDCTRRLTAETSVGLVAWDTVSAAAGTILDPLDFRIRHTIPGIPTVVGDDVLSWSGEVLTIFDTTTGATVQVDAPPTDGQPSVAEVSPDGASVAISFMNPAWPGPRQLLDIWLLDRAALTWMRLPSMPIAASLKFTATQWLADGRFAMFGDFDETGVAIALWTPGDPTFELRHLDTVPTASAVIWCEPPTCA